MRASLSLVYTRVVTPGEGGERTEDILDLSVMDVEALVDQPTVLVGSSGGADGQRSGHNVHQVQIVVFEDYLVAREREEQGQPNDWRGGPKAPISANKEKTTAEIWGPEGSSRELFQEYARLRGSLHDQSDIVREMNVRTNRLLDLAVQAR